MSESMLKSMLLTLQTYLHRELQMSIFQIHDMLDCLGERTDTVEEHISEMSKAHNKLLDAYDHHSDEIQKVKLNLEDRSRRNIKVRDIRVDSPLTN